MKPPSAGLDRVGEVRREQGQAPACKGCGKETCLVCDDTGWVCENHPDQPWHGLHACACGGAGASLLSAGLAVGLPSMTGESSSRKQVLNLGKIIPETPRVKLPDAFAAMGTSLKPPAIIWTARSSQRSWPRAVRIWCSSACGFKREAFVFHRAALYASRPLPNLTDV